MGTEIRIEQAVVMLRESSNSYSRGVTAGDKLPKIWVTVTVAE